MVRSFYGGECLGKLILPARDSWLNWCRTMEFLILRFACSWRLSQVFSSALSSAFWYRFSIMFFITVFCCCVSNFISVFVFSATSISLYRLSQIQKIGNAILICLPKKKKIAVGMAETLE